MFPTFPRPESSSVFGQLAFDYWQHPGNRLFHRDNALDFPVDLDICRHVSHHFPRMYCQYANIAVFPLQLSGHVSKHLIESSFGGSIRAKAVLEVPKVRRGAAVAGDEDDVLDYGRGEPQQLLRNDYRTDRVRAEVQCEI